MVNRQPSRGTEVRREGGRARWQSMVGEGWESLSGGVN